MKHFFLSVSPWRGVGLLLGFLLIVGVICAVALPYLNHLVYPDSLPRSMQGRGAGYAAIPEDRQIDELGGPEHIRTEADARAYVEALVKRWDPRETNPRLPEFEERLARAEYAAVRNPAKLISESQVTKTFNQLQNEWQMPDWTHISEPELHAFRITYASSVYPRSVARLPDGSIAPGCRPTEALFLLHMLNFNGGVPPQIRDQVRASRWPWNFLKRLEWTRPTDRPVEEGLHAETAPTPDSFQRNKYAILQHDYFASHPTIGFENEIEEVFSQLGIQ